MLAKKSKTLNQAGMVDHLTAIVVMIVIFGALGTYLLVRGNAATVCAQQTIGLGTSGKCVTDAQQMLNGFVAAHSLYPTYSYAGSSLAVNGKYGSSTTAQARYYQGRFKMSNNGLIGQQTWTSMCMQLDHLPFGEVTTTAPHQHDEAVINTAMSARANSQCHN